MGKLWREVLSETHWKCPSWLIARYTQSKQFNLIFGKGRSARKRERYFAKYLCVFGSGETVDRITCIEQ